MSNQRRKQRTVVVHVVRLFCLLISLLFTAGAGLAQTTAFTYQGRLTDGGTPPTGTYDMQFKLYDTATVGTGTLRGLPNTVTNSTVTVTNGVFTVQLDFGASGFPGADRFLEINVRHPGDPSYTALSPRQQLTSTPYAIQALTATNNVLKSGDTMTGPLVLSGDPTASLGVATKQYVDNANALKLNLSGGTMAGVLSMGNNKIASLATPTIGTDAANKSYVDAAVAGGSGVFPWLEVSGTSQQAQPNTGYVATNAGQVTITLPTAPNIGDTIRVSGAGAGGWRIAQNSGQQIITPNNSVSNFTGSKNWFSVASSADGSKLVALDFDGLIYISTDSGAAWTPRDDANGLPTGGWTSVASSADGSKLVALDFGGFIYTSTDSGANWNPRDTSRGWISVASSADGSKLVALDFGGFIYTSTDSGANWTPRDSNRSWQSVASSADGSKLVAVVNGGQIYTSTNSGVNWTPRDSVRNWFSVASSSDGSKLVAVVVSGQIYTSTDSGASWTPRDSNRAWVSVASSSDGSKLVALVNNGGVNSVAGIYTSTDSGVTWTTTAKGTFPGTGGALFGGKSTAIELQYIGGGRFLPLSHEGTLFAQ